MTGEVRGRKVHLAPQETEEVRCSEHKMEHIANADNEEGEVRAPIDATAPCLERPGDKYHLDREGINPELILSILKTATRMFAPEAVLPIETLQQLAVEAIASADGNYGVKEAVKWADGFEFPQDLVDSDLRLFKASQQWLRGASRKSGPTDYLAVA